MLIQLINKSLIVAQVGMGGTRYRLLETIREYGLEKLSGADEDNQIRIRHLECFVQLAEQAKDGLLLSDQEIALRELDAEYGNLRSALEWAMESDAQAIAIPVNSVGVAGAGLALAAARRWPYWAESYKAAYATGDIERVGDVELHRNLQAGPEWIISVTTKGHWQKKSTLPGVKLGLQNLAIVLRDHRIRSLALPALGCGLGCLPWNEVRALIWEYLEGSSCEIRVYTPPLRVIVAGSRTITNYRLVVQAIQESGFTIREIISGGARGVDRLGLRYARGHKIQTVVFPANWKRDGKAAGFIRNEKMAEVAHALIAIWDGKSKGTKHMIDLARRLDLTVHIHQVNSLPGE